MFKKSLCIILTFALCLSAFCGFGTAFAQEEPLESDFVIELSSDILSYSSTDVVCKQIPCKSLGGIYFLNGNTLSFFALIPRTYELVCTFEKADMTFKTAFCTETEVYSLFSNADENAVICYDLINRKITKEISFSGNVTAIGVDNGKRYYIATKEAENYGIHLLSADGEELSFASAENKIEEFYGFDDVSGNYYVNSLSNWNYGGYDHDFDTLRIGTVKDNVISYDNTIVQYLSNSYYYDRQRTADLFGNYLFIECVVENELQIYNANTADFIRGIPRTIERTNKIESVGSRAVYVPSANTVIAYKSDTQIAEYEISSGSELCYSETRYPVFSLLGYGEDEVIAIEKKDGKYCFERITWKRANDFDLEIVGEAQVSNTLKASVSSNSYLGEYYSWSSSNTKVATVNENCDILCWGVGSTEITVKNNYGFSVTRKLDVAANENSTEIDNPAVMSNGEKSANVSKNNYTVWSKVVTSYLYENADGTFCRVEFTGKDVLVENYGSDMKEVKSTLHLPLELEIFGGFFSGEKYNFLVFGQRNDAESDENEVIKVVKYDKSWNRLGDMSICGANTQSPFDAGSLRMTETDGNLYIYTCHKMYKSSDGQNHQANMIFKIDEEALNLADSFYSVYNLKDAGYVSHSFNQFIQTDGKDVYRVDHSDALPRGITIIKNSADGSLTDIKYVIPVSLEKVSGGNDTGASIGGFELSDNNCLIAGNSVNFAMEAASSSTRNIFLAISNKELTGIKLIWFTRYSDADGIRVHTPQLVKLGGDSFLLMWEEEKDSQITTKMMTIDADGNRTSNIIETLFRLSDCQPIFCSDNSVCWYFTDNDSPTFYTINPFGIEQSTKPSIIGDINEDGTLDIIDVALARSFIVGSKLLTDQQISSGDMNGDGKLDIIDVVMMRREIVG